VGTGSGKSYVVFGKQDNTNAIELSAIAAGTGGFVINECWRFHHRGNQWCILAHRPILIDL
jgi:hypothetical protein